MRGVIFHKPAATAEKNRDAFGHSNTHLDLTQKQQISSYIQAKKIVFKFNEIMLIN